MTGPQDPNSSPDRGSRDELVAALQAWARGLYPSEAAVGLLVSTRLCHRIAFDPAVVEWSDNRREPMAGVYWPALVEHANAGPYSGGERRLLLIAAALAGQPCEFDVSNLDDDNLLRVLLAVAHAAGRVVDVSLWGRR